MKELINARYMGTTLYGGVECDVWEYYYNGGEIYYDLIPTIDEEYEAWLDEYYFRMF